MTACGAVGALMVGGRVVGQLRCEKDLGHSAQGFPTHHSVALSWAPEAEADLDLFDPDEHFDVDVPIVCQYVHNFGIHGGPGDRCKTCGMTWEAWREAKAADRR